MIALQAFKYALDPSPTKERMLRSHVGARRFAFNWGLALVKSRLDGRERGEAGAVPWTLPALRREWNRAKVSAAPWWREHSKEAYNAGLEGLAHALKNFSASKRGTRRGRRVGFPAFKRRHRGRQSVRFTTGAIRIVDRTHIQLPRIGIVRTDEPTSALREKLDAGRARILSATASLDGDRWQVSFTCLVERTVGRPAQPDVVVGADAGLRGTVTSTGEVMPNPRALPTALGKVARLNRELAGEPRVATAGGRRGSNSAGRTRACGTSARTRCTRRRPGWRNRTGWWSPKRSASMGCSSPAGSLALSPMLPWRSSAGSSGTSARGTARRSSRPHAGSEVRRPAPAAGR